MSAHGSRDEKTHPLLLQRRRAELFASTYLQASVRKVPKVKKHAVAATLALVLLVVAGGAFLFREDRTPGARPLHEFKNQDDATLLLTKATGMTNLDEAKSLIEALQDGSLDFGTVSSALEEDAAREKAKIKAEIEKQASRKAAEEKAAAEKVAAEKAAAEKAAADKAAADKAAAEKAAEDKAAAEREPQKMHKAVPRSFIDVFHENDDDYYDEDDWLGDDVEDEIDDGDSLALPRREPKRSALFDNQGGRRAQSRRGHDRAPSTRSWRNRMERKGPSRPSEDTARGSRRFRLPDVGVGGSVGVGGITIKKESSSELSSQLRLFDAGDDDGTKDKAAAATAAAGNGQASPDSSSTVASGKNSTLPLLPPDFDWRLYLVYNPDLRASGVSDAKSAAAHFLARGREEGRPAARLRVALRYTACTGLINQHYSHIAALSLASVLGTEVVLPPAAQRDSFAHYFSTSADRNEVSWTSAPLETLLDVQGLIETWKQREKRGGGGGLTLRPAPSTAPFPDLTSPGTAYPSYAAAAASAAAAPDLSTVANVSDVYQRNLDMAALVEKVRAAAVGKAVALRRAQLAAAAASAAGSSSPLPPLPLITVDLPCTFFMLRTSDSLDVVTGVARTLKFAPLLVKLADKVSRGVVQAAAAEAAAAEALARVPILSSTTTSSSAAAAAAAAPPVLIQATDFPSASSSSATTTTTAKTTLPFNGVHLRIEADARDWEEILGGRAALWGGYLAAARAARFDARTPLYVASGLLTYGASAEMDKVAADIRTEGLASSIHYKEQHLTSAELASLNSEQKAAVDFLVLSRSQSFVGLGSSTFSFYIREHRALEGIPRSSTVLVDASKIGTNDLFASAGMVV